MTKKKRQKPKLISTSYIGGGFWNYYYEGGFVSVGLGRKEDWERLENKMKYFDKIINGEIKLDWSKSEPYSIKKICLDEEGK